MAEAIWILDAGDSDGGGDAGGGVGDVVEGGQRDVDDVGPGSEVEANVFDGAESAGVAVVVVVGHVEGFAVDGVDVVRGAD